MNSSALHVDRRLLAVLRFAALLIGAVHAAVAARDHMMNEDGIQYLDLGDRYARGEWSPINSVWSPLYPLLLGLAVRATGAGPRWEFLVAHAVTFLIYAVALGCFEFFWRAAERAVRAESRAAEPAPLLFPPWAWWAIGYALFVWSSVVLIRFRAVTPDMLVAALTYLAAGLLVRASTGRAGVRDAVSLGGVAGVAYLAKAAMFPIGLLLLGAAGWLRWRQHRDGRSWLAGLAAFAIVTLPLVFALSVQKGRLTIGDAGTFTYLKHVNGVSYPYDPGELPAGVGTPVHPIRRAHDAPKVLEFATPVAGTYPLGFDPSYWTEGLSPRIVPANQLRALAAGAAFYSGLFLQQQGGALALLALLLWLARGERLRAPASRWPLALVGVACGALALYALVYAEGRYVAPFVVLAWGGLLALVRIADAAPSRRVVLGAGTLIPALFVVQLASFDIAHVAPTPGAFLWQWRAAPHRQDAPWRVAEALHQAGVGPGSRVGVIGYAYGATFARLARVRIVAEMAEEHADALWALGPDARDEVLGAFARAGAVAVVADVAPPTRARDGWRELGGSGRYVRVLAFRAATTSLDAGEHSMSPDHARAARPDR